MTWTATRSKRAALVAAILAVQLLVPLAALRHERPAAFGWHMFVAVRGKPDVTILHRDGTEQHVDIDDLVVRYRPEIDFPSRVTPEVCDGDPTVEAVRYERNGEHLGTVPC